MTDAEGTASPTSPLVTRDPDRPPSTGSIAAANARPQRVTAVPAGDRGGPGIDADEPTSSDPRAWRRWFAR